MGFLNLFHPAKKKVFKPSPKKPKAAKDLSSPKKRETPDRPQTTGTPTSTPVKSAIPFTIPSCARVSPDRVNAALRRKNPNVPQQDIEVFCAVKQVRVYCHSHILDKMSDLTKFIICSIAEGRTLDDIIALTQLGGYAVEEETSYLKKGKLLEDSENLVLTPLGQEHFRLIQIFSELSKGIDAQLNLYTDQIETRVKQLYEQNEIAPDAFILNGKFSKVLLQNYNYSNSLEFVQPFLQGDLPFRSEILESLYTSIRLERDERTSVYQKLKVPSLYECAYSGHVEGEICFSLPVHELHYRLRIYALDHYRTVLDTLDRLEQFEKQLLSERSMLLTRRFREDRDESEYVICADLYHGDRCRSEWTILHTPPEGSFLVTPCYPEIQFELEDKSEQIGRDFYLEELERVPRYLCISLPYSSLICG